METYQESLLSPKTGKIENAMVFEHLANDLINIEHLNCCKRPDCVEEGDRWTKLGDGTWRVDRIKPEQYRLFIERFKNEVEPLLKLEYHKRVAELAGRWIEEFKNQKESRGGGKEFTTRHLTYCKGLIIPDNKFTIIEDPIINHLHFMAIRGTQKAVYKKLIEKKKREYINIISDPHELSAHIAIEATYEFFLYLQEEIKMETSLNPSVDKTLAQILYELQEIKMDTSLVPSVRKTLNNHSEALAQILDESQQNELFKYVQSIVNTKFPPESEERKTIKKAEDDPTLSSTSKFKLSVPLIPAILSYETHLDLSNKLSFSSLKDFLSKLVQPKEKKNDLDQ